MQNESKEEIKARHPRLWDSLDRLKSNGLWFSNHGKDSLCQRYKVSLEELESVIKAFEDHIMKGGSGA